MSEKMRAMAVNKESVEMVEIPKPNPGTNEVRVKVISASVNPAEEKVISGGFVGRILHAKTSPLIVGWDFAGTVDEVGNGVSDLEKGTPVWGHLAFSNKTRQGSFSEYITLPRTELAVKPDNVPSHIAAAAATISMTSLQSLRDIGGLQKDGKVLVIGAAGGVGSVAVGIAKRLGAHVTAVCSTKDVERVTALGADLVIDRKKSNPLESESEYDLVFDTPAVHSFGSCAKTLKAKGTYVTTLPGPELISGMIKAIFSSKNCRFVAVVSKSADLELVGEMLNDGMMVPIDSRHKIADLGVALKRQTDPARSGRVVVDVADGWTE
ncbi:MAG: NAD(P)-dependent alcohol dehydrogenase [Calditrichaeota bacterium]|nr:MAG: NAD(P)-dependent alcohol dehydrogenase [Calditrichota bacterium]MBL1207859.1 NAD(P)-dependent alcohol dehydrogenase [Calditrichota bacterium]NOG47693.1 NAD(P)-dependent alcohol dehydrogenase [Calditrichota bacterium]